MRWKFGIVYLNGERTFTSEDASQLVQNLFLLGRRPHLKTHSVDSKSLCVNLNIYTAKQLE